MGFVGVAGDGLLVAAGAFGRAVTGVLGGRGPVLLDELGKVNPVAERIADRVQISP